MPEYTEEQIVQIKAEASKSAISDLMKKLGGTDVTRLTRLAEVSKKHDIDEVLRENGKLKLTNEVTRAASKHGFGDVDYATFLYEKKTSSMKEDELKEFNPDKFLESIKQDNSLKHHFTVGSVGTIGDSKRPPQSREGTATDMSDASPEQLKQYFAELGLQA